MAMTGPSGAEVTRLCRALGYAAAAHANQRRKGAAQEPYLNHLIEVMELVCEATGGGDTDLLVAALLHDAIEDSGRTEADLTAAFGARVARIVAQNSDDMTLPKPERKARRIAAMADKPVDARIVKIADLISNLRAIDRSPPAGWTVDWRLGYLDGCKALVDAGRGANAALEAAFDSTAAAIARRLGDAGPGADALVAELDSGVGQPVYLLYLANTRREALTADHARRLIGLAGAIFPSVTLQRAEALYDGVTRDVLLLRIRSDSAEAVVQLAQQVCVAFDQAFAGIEVAGRYIRVYADDTG